MKEKIFNIFIVIALSLMIVAGCGSNADGASGNVLNTTETSSGVTTSLETVEVTYDTSDSYFDWKTQGYTTIDLNQGSKTITKSGIYELTGALADGSITVDVDNSSDSGIVYLILNNAEISSSTSAPIYIKDAEKTVLILEENTKNKIYQGADCDINEDEEPSAAIFSKSDLTITGSGSLEVTSDFNDGITGKDSVKITDGVITVRAKSDGIVGKDLLAVKKANITIEAGKDGMRSTNETDEGMGNVVIEDGIFAISSENDGIQAYNILQINGGTFNLTTGGGYAGVIKTSSNFERGGKNNIDFQPPDNNTNTNIDINKETQTDEEAATDTESQKCLKADGGILIENGTFKLSSYEDGIHSNGNIIIKDGTFTVKSGDDAIHSDGNLEVADGTITVENSNEGMEGKNITLSGGTINITSSDDGINVNDNAGVLSIGGGSIYLNSEGDGLDSNGSINMTGGTVYVNGPTNSGNGAIDYNASFTISGGTLVATGSSGMAEAPDSGSSQPSILMYYSSAQAAGTTISLKDSGGNIVATYTPEKQYSSAVISAPGLKTGQTYKLYSGDTEIVSFTISDVVTYLNESGVTTNQSKGPGQERMNRGPQREPGQMPQTPASQQ